MATRHPVLEDHRQADFAETKRKAISLTSCYTTKLSATCDMAVNLVSECLRSSSTAGSHDAATLLLTGTRFARTRNAQGQDESRVQGSDRCFGWNLSSVQGI